MKKTEDMYDFLETKEGGEIPSSNIIGFPNGISELLFGATLDRCINQDTKSILLYFCTKEPISDTAQSFFIGAEEIRKDVIAHYQNLAKDMEFDLQVVYDVDRQMLAEEELGYEAV